MSLVVIRPNNWSERIHICDPSARNESHVGSIQVEKTANIHDMG